MTDRAQCEFLVPPDALIRVDGRTGVEREVYDPPADLCSWALYAAEKLKDTLRKVAKSLRVAGGLPEPPPADERTPLAPGRPDPALVPGAPASPGEPQPGAAPVPRQRKAGLDLPGKASPDIRP